MVRSKAPLVIKDSLGNVFKLQKTKTNKGIFCYLNELIDFKIYLTPLEVEKFFHREKPSLCVIKQNYWECVIASVSMLTKKDQNEVRQAFLNCGWNKKAGFSFPLIKKSLRELGYSSMYHDQAPTSSCLVFSESLNSSEVGHCLCFDGENLLDPQTNNEGFLWYGSDWSIDAIGWGFLTVTNLPVKLL